MTPLLLLLTLGLGATGRDPPGVAEPVAALEALLSSGSGSLPHGTVESLVGIAAGRAQCRAGPCGKCLSAGAVLALVGKAGAAARLEAAEVPWLGAAVLVTLRDPPAACADAATGRWAARARALHRAFTATGTATTDATATATTNATANATGTGTGTGSGSGGPGLREVAELLAAVVPNYRSADGQEACVDAAGALAAGAAVSPRVGAGRGARVLAALGALVLRGRCLRPPPPPGFFLDYVFLRFGHGPALAGLSALMEQLGLGPGEQQHPPSPPGAPHGDPPHGDGDPDALPRTHIQSQPWDTLCLAPPELLQALGVPGGAPLSRGGVLRLAPALLQQQLSRACAPPRPPAPPHRHGPAATGPTATSPTATSPVATSPAATGQLSIAERYALGTVAGLALALCPLLALALLQCPLCHRAQRWLRPLLLGLAAGALSGDALLHLLPQFLGLHTHAEGSHAHAEGSHGHAGGAEPPWQLLGVLGGLFGAFLLEGGLGALLAPGEEGKADDANLDRSTQELQSRGPRALSCVVTVAHAAHSLTDGLALGAAFATSWRSGAATGLALLCHALPHALGDLAVLAQAGVGARRALGLGLAGALPALPGLYAGLALGTPGPARAWLGAAATGLLLHLALCRMVPAMLAARAERPWVLLGLQSAGLLGGWGLLLGLALGEESGLR